MSGTVQSTHLNAARVTVDSAAVVRKTQLLYMLAKCAYSFEGQGLEGDTLAKRTLGVMGGLIATGPAGEAVARALALKLLPDLRAYAAEAVSMSVRHVRTTGVLHMENFLKHSEG